MDMDMNTRPNLPHLAHFPHLPDLLDQELARELFEAVCSVKEHSVSASPSKQAAAMQQVRRDAPPSPPHPHPPCASPTLTAAATVAQQPPTEYTLPDGRVISIGQERFRLPEYLFHVRPLATPHCTHCTHCTPQCTLRTRPPVFLRAPCRAMGGPRRPGPEAAAPGRGARRRCDEDARGVVRDVWCGAVCRQGSNNQNQPSSAQQLHPLHEMVCHTLQLAEPELHKELVPP